jgi:hypothetical protein
MIVDRKTSVGAAEGWWSLPVRRRPRWSGHSGRDKAPERQSKAPQFLGPARSLSSDSHSLTIRD